MSESKSWIAVGIFSTAFCIGVFCGCFGTSLMHADKFEVPTYASKQEIFTLPDGTTWKRIRTPEEVK